MSQTTQIVALFGVSLALILWSIFWQQIKTIALGFLVMQRIYETKIVPFVMILWTEIPITIDQSKGSTPYWMWHFLSSWLHFFGADPMQNGLQDKQSEEMKESMCRLPVWVVLHGSTMFCSDDIGRNQLSIKVFPHRYGKMVFEKGFKMGWSEVRNTRIFSSNKGGNFFTWTLLYQILRLMFEEIEWCSERSRELARFNN